MTFLPIVSRELRAASRRRGTYSVRLVVAMMAIAVGTVIFLIYLGLPPASVGHAIFIGLSVLAMVYCLLAGRLSTADCVSQEKREGTLGLLFLTDLKGYDVVLGKLVATSVGAFYGLLAMMPVLAVPLLLGGSSNAEFWRVALVLLVTFLFSLSVGMLGSALSRDARRAMAANFALMLLLAFVLPVCAAIVITVFTISPGQTVGPSDFIIPSPIFSCCLAFDSLFNTKPGQFHFWLTLGIVAAGTFLMLWLTSVIVPRTWQDKSAPQVRTRRLTWRGFWRALSYGRLAKQAPHRKRLLDINAFYWLSARARLKPLHVWIFMGLTMVWWIMGWFDAGIVWYDPLITITLALILNATFKSWVAIEAGQQLAEDRDGGALELLLSTPLTVRDILYGQYLALRRQFLKPLILVVLLELIFMQAEATYAGTKSVALGAVHPRWLAGIFILIADIITLTLVAWRTALTAKNVNRATISTMTRILFLPWAIFAVGAGIANLWAALFAANGYLPGFNTYLVLWFGASLAVDLFFGLRAWKQLRGSFREIASRQSSGVSSQVSGSVSTESFGFPRPASALFVAARDLVEAIAPTGSRKRRYLGVGGAVVVLVACVTGWRYWTKPNYPPPITVSITQSNGPLRVVGGTAGSGVLLILPDDSLWRWGAAGVLPRTGRQGRTAVPEKAGTNNDWSQLATYGDHSVGLRKDGTIWEWGWVRSGTLRHFQDEPIQVGSDNDWSSVSTGAGHSVGIKKDGTLWVWGDRSWAQLRTGPWVVPPRNIPPPSPSSTELSQIGTNSDWTAIACQAMGTFALRKDGTLWVWGMPVVGPRPASPGPPEIYNAPVQVCRETNWVGFTSGFGYMVWARNKSGELRQVLTSRANPEAGAASTCTLVSTEGLPGHLISAFSVTPRLYELRADGTLWEKSYSLPGWTVPSEDWHRFGKRSDWVGIWGGGGTAIGLTADGTVWMWGIDSSQQPTLDFSARLAMLQVQIKQFLGTAPARGRASGPISPVFQKTPRPLMRLKYSATPGTNSMTSQKTDRE